MENRKEVIIKYDKIRTQLKSVLLDVFGKNTADIDVVLTKLDDVLIDKKSQFETKSSVINKIN